MSNSGISVNLHCRVKDKKISLEVSFDELYERIDERVKHGLEYLEYISLKCDINKFLGSIYGISVYVNKKEGKEERVLLGETNLSMNLILRFDMR